MRSLTSASVRSASAALVPVPVMSTICADVGEGPMV